MKSGRVGESKFQARVVEGHSQNYSCLMFFVKSVIASINNNFTHLYYESTGSFASDSFEPATMYEPYVFLHEYAWMVALLMRIYQQLP